MNTLDAELALDRLEARLAAELPPHVTAMAEAYASHAPPPAGLSISQREVAAVLAARAFGELLARSTRVLRAIEPIVIDSAPRVSEARGRERTWQSYRALAAAREDEAQRWFGLSHRTLVHALAGTPKEHAPDAAIGAEIAGWRDAERALSDDAIVALWKQLCASSSLGSLSILRGDAHPRTFVVERGARALIVVPDRIDTPAARFAVLHELGHALLWLAPISRELEWPRAIDEAAASYVARTMESTTLEAWHSPHAAAARARRLAIAKRLDAIERGADPGDIARPPWALWHDPFAQAAYVEAERIADDLPAGLRGRDLAELLAARARDIDAAPPDTLRAWCAVTTTPDRKI